MTYLIINSDLSVTETDNLSIEDFANPNIRIIEINFETSNIRILAGDNFIDIDS